MLEKNRLYDHLIEEIGKSSLDEPSEELAEIVDCIAHGLYGLRDRNIEVVLKRKHTIYDIGVEVPEDLEEGQEEFVEEFSLTKDDRELIFQFLKSMYVTYDLAKKPRFIEQG